MVQPDIVQIVGFQEKSNPVKELSEHPLVDSEEGGFIISIVEDFFYWIEI